MDELKLQQEVNDGFMGLIHSAAYSIVTEEGGFQVDAEMIDIEERTVLPTPESSKKWTNRLSHLEMANSTRTPPGFFPSHAGSLAVISLGFLQCSSTCDRVILAELRQN